MSTHELHTAGRLELKLDEGERQLVLLALAVPSLRSPGFYAALGAIARRIDIMTDTGHAQTFEEFRRLRRDIETPSALRPCVICGSLTDHTRQPTYEDRTTGRRVSLTEGPVWVCDGCAYESANFKGRYVDEREGTKS